MKKRYKAEIKQGGIIVASVDAPSKETAEREIQHYALMYSEEGPMEILRNYKPEIEKC